MYWLGVPDTCTLLLPLTPVQLHVPGDCSLLFLFSFRALFWSGYTMPHWYRWLAIGHCTVRLYPTVIRRVVGPQKLRLPFYSPSLICRLEFASSF